MCHGYNVSSWIAWLNIKDIFDYRAAWRNGNWELVKLIHSRDVVKRFLFWAEPRSLTVLWEFRKIPPMGNAEMESWRRKSKFQTASVQGFSPPRTKRSQMLSHPGTTGDQAGRTLWEVCQRAWEALEFLPGAHQYRQSVMEPGWRECVWFGKSLIKAKMFPQNVPHPVNPPCPIKPVRQENSWLALLAALKN